MEHVDLTDLLPLPASAFHVLMVLAGGDSHGYAISKQVAELTEGRIRLGSGTLYRQLRQMSADGWIIELANRDDDAMGRRYYRLTTQGRRIAQAEAARMETLVKVAHSRQLLPAPVL